MRGLCTTVLTKNLNNLIPIRVYFRWDEKKLGFFETGTVSHDGGNASGQHIYTVTATDVSNSWPEIRPVLNKAHQWVKNAINDIKINLPYRMKGLDSDNGNEFKNYQVLDWCNENKITFTRSRSYHKNDNCVVEQKNKKRIR